MGESPPNRPHIVRVANLPPRGREVGVALGASDRAALAADLGILDLPAAGLTGRLVPEGGADWRLAARIAASVVQRCVVTLDPVETRIDEPVDRLFRAGPVAGDGEVVTEGGEIEMPDETVEPLGREIDLAAILVEEIALALPAYPRKDGVELDRTVFAAPGVAPLTDAELKPFAALGRLTSGTDDPEPD